MIARARTPVGTVLVTGAAGYLGRQVALRLARRHLVVGLDVATPEVDFQLRHMDVRDPAMADVLAAERPTHVIHLAAILDGDVDVDLAHDIDVNGTANVVATCVAADVGHLTVTSSGAAYGYHADNPVPLHEDDPLRGKPPSPTATTSAWSRNCWPTPATTILRWGNWCCGCRRCWVLGPTTSSPTC